MMAKQDIPTGAIPLELAVLGRAFVREVKRRGFKITERSGPVEVVGRSVRSDGLTISWICLGILRDPAGNAGGPAFRRRAAAE